MKRRISTSTLRKRLPREFVLPASFDTFVKTAATTNPARQGFYHITWSDAPYHFGFRRECLAEAIPFLVFGDGGVVAFWLQKKGDAPKTSASAAIVHFDSEGSNRVVAANFDDFLVRLTLRKTGVPDIDEADAAITFPPTLRLPRKSAPITPALRARFAKWCEENIDNHRPDASAAGDLEKLRKKLYDTATKMLCDGIHSIYKARHVKDWWSLHFRVVRKGSALQITYIDGGIQKPLPADYGAEPLIRDLLANVKHPNRAAYAILINKPGLISVDRDRELILEPAAPKNK